MSRFGRKASVGVVVTALAVLASCGGNSTGPKTADLSGAWKWSANVSNSTAATSCVISGGFAISQTGSNFTAQASTFGESCTSPQGPANAVYSGFMSGSGQISGATATYSFAGCSFTGTATGTPVNRVSGTARCSDVDGPTYPFDGTFVMSR